MKTALIQKIFLLVLATCIVATSSGQNTMPADPKMYHLDTASAPQNFKGNIRDLEWLVGDQSRIVLAKIG